MRNFDWSSYCVITNAVRGNMGHSNDDLPVKLLLLSLNRKACCMIAANSVVRCGFKNAASGR